MSKTLGERIKRQITRDGPMSLADYMALCLADPQQGYYTTASPFGRGGDFITAPEINQMFGELIGIWCVAMWRNIGAPERINLVEMGPGRGTLMEDILRAAAIDPDFLNAMSVKLVEISKPLRERQKQRLATKNTTITWVENLDKIENVPTLFIGNEFFDALPFHQYVKSGGLWLERMVGLKNDKLSYVTGVNLADPTSMPVDHYNEEAGAIFETSPAREATIATICNHIQRNSGAALLIDYGHRVSGFGDTFQAVSAHIYTDPLSCPGKADLTGHVDFSALQKVASGFGNLASLTTCQGDFLLAMGLLERAGSLGRGKSKVDQNALHEAVERLAGNDAMGNLFKVLAIAPRGSRMEGLIK